VSMTKELGVGVVSSGKMGRVYLHWFSRNPTCKLRALYNRTFENARASIAEYGIRFCSSWEELVSSPDIDIVGLCGPPSLHAAQAVAAARARKSVLCEKPMAASLSECRGMIEVVEQFGVTLMIGFQLRFHVVVRCIDELLGRIGRPFHLELMFPMYRPGVTWRHRLVEGGGVLNANCCHLFDLARHWLGEIGHLSAENNIVVRGREVEDLSIAIFRFRSGATGLIYGTYNDRREPAIEGTILGTEGQIGFTLSPYRPELNRVSLMIEDSEEHIDLSEASNLDPVYPGHCDSFKQEIDHFVTCVLERREPLVTGLDGLKAMEAVFAAYESQRRGTKVYLPLQGFEVDGLELCFPEYL
jgi:UDP-N-acetyl-2-amino-2-deoxyglucuronate dehydrogenase